MTWYVIIDPKEKLVIPFTGTFAKAKERAGLDKVGLDFSLVAPRISYCVYEFGLFDPPEEQSYFAVKGRLIAGNAVFSGIDDDGEDKDLAPADLPEITWFENAEEIETAIDQGMLTRPYMAVDDEVFWKWPEPKPKEVMG